MRTRIFQILMVTFLSVTLAGCTTMADARLAKGTGPKQTFKASKDATWDATICSFNGLGLSIAGDNKEDGYIMAQRGMTAFSYGENVVIYLRAVSKNETEVEVISKKVMQTNIFAPDWSPKVFQGINACLKS